MFTREEHKRYNLLRERELARSLDKQESAELSELMQKVLDTEAACLSPANESKATAVAEVSPAIERLIDENRQMREYLDDRWAFLAHATALIAQLRREDREIRERFRNVIVLSDERSVPSRP